MEMSYGKITSIKEVANFPPEEKEEYQYRRQSGMDGFVVKTDKNQEILILIDNHQCCCEDWGYFSLYDNEQDFVGAELFSVNLVNNVLDVKAFKKQGGEWIDVGSCIFVNLETSKGTLQFTVYNEHNGYYSHFVKVKCRDFEEDQYL